MRALSQNRDKKSLYLPLRDPGRSMSDLDAAGAARLLAAAADLALVLDEEGVIRDISMGGMATAGGAWPEFLGRRWIDTVTDESRDKIDALLRSADADEEPRWRQVNHPLAEGPDRPVAYSAIRLGAGGPQLAIGRDLSAMSQLQQQLVQIQQSMERDYARFRQAEARYRLLFQIASEAVVVVDAANNRIVEANPAAGRLLGVTPQRLVDRVFPAGLTDRSLERARSYLNAVKSSGEAPDVVVQSREGHSFRLAASLMRQGGEALLLVHLLPLQDGATPSAAFNQRLYEILDHSPDGFVVTDPEGRVLTANPAFLEMCQLGATQQVMGKSLDLWLGREGVDVPVLTRNLRAEGGSIRQYRTIVRGDLGSQLDVELSAVAVIDGDEPCLGFTIRVATAPATSTSEERLPVPQSISQLTELVGQVPLKELVRETTHVIERLCIEAALELTGNNRASAAAMLGLSRQSLYVKLRRYGLVDGDSEPD